MTEDEPVDLAHLYQASGTPAKGAWYRTKFGFFLVLAIVVILLGAGWANLYYENYGVPCSWYVPFSGPAALDQGPGPADTCATLLGAELSQFAFTWVAMALSFVGVPIVGWLGSKAGV